MSDCLFCKIVNKEIPAKVVFEDDQILAFEDVSPQAPVHILVIPKNHIPSLEDTGPSNTNLLGRLLEVARDQARVLKIDADGYRTVINTGANGGQAVFHIHVHLLGGRPMAWPPG